MRITPCKDCVKRYTACHSTCKDYRDWKREKNEDNARRNKQKNAEKITDDYKIKVMQKTRRKYK